MSYAVKHYMKKDVPTIQANASATEGAKVLIKSGRGFVIVLKEKEPIGIVTEHDFVAKVIANEKDITGILISDIMSSPLITIDPDEEFLNASEMMHNHNIRRLPVVKDGVVHGVLTARDIAQHLREYLDRSIRDVMKWASPI